jgi:hypothetical protein
MKALLETCILLLTRQCNLLHLTNTTICFKIFLSFSLKFCQVRDVMLQEIYFHRRGRIWGHILAQSDNAIRSWSMAGSSPESSNSISCLVLESKVLTSLWCRTGTRLQLSTDLVLCIQCPLLSR